MSDRQAAADAAGGWWAALRRAGRMAPLVVAAACGGEGASTEPAPEPGPRDRGRAAVRWLTGMTQADTIDAAAGERLVLEVRDTLGRPWRDEWIVVGSALIGGDAAEQRQGIQFLPDAGASGGGSVIGVRTDSDGRAAVRFRFGPRPGPSYVFAQLAEDDSIYAATVVETRAGRPARLELSPRDTALYVGGELLPGGRAFDRVGTPLLEPVEVRGAVGAVEALPDGRVRARALGRGSVTMRAGSTVDSTRVVVVPEGTIAALRMPAVCVPPLQPLACHFTVVVNLDGSGYREIAPLQTLHYAPPAWSADGRSIVVSVRVGGREGLAAVDLETGERRTLVQSDSSAFSRGVYWGRLSRDGAWLYFSTSGVWPLHEQWRQRLDGGVPEQLAAGAHPRQHNWRGDPSPDGRRLAFVTTDTAGAPRLALLDHESGAVRVVDLPVQAPRWSPDGTRLAYVSTVDRGIWITDAEGSNARLVSPAGRSYGEGVDWSGDGRWLVVHSGMGLELLPVGGGASLPLPYSIYLVAPSFRP